MIMVIIIIDRQLFMKILIEKIALNGKLKSKSLYAGNYAHHSILIDKHELMRMGLEILCQMYLLALRKEDMFCMDVVDSS